MANIHGLYSNNTNRQESDDSDDEHNERYVGGVSARGGGRYVFPLCFFFLKFFKVFFQTTFHRESFLRMMYN